ncbi:spermidine/putrescine ABC transporter permease PotC [Loktanella sp. D2R18]|uniref:ABC transporter permease n=1 Tax=Rhodobacterales TaxID=204455 RepID=UPI000DEBBD1B|nr:MULTISPECIES: ABC transporter permease [Rhodobacterales]MDO6589752.1 ABC transporter permease [Yoonia sp. 1_MG-2023]RBW44376.1 spermidine/putrescine ABC transporter permease PotC [Loktanella sp. D2R18]
MTRSRDIRWLPGFSWVTLFFFVFLYAPLIILVVFSFNASRSATVWAGFSFEWYTKAFANDDIQRAATNSVIIAIFATIAATTIATMAALTLSRNKRVKGKPVFGGVLIFPLMIPEIVTAVATLTFFAAIGLSLGLGNIIIAHTVFCIPFAYLPIRARLDGMDESLEAAAQDLYASKFTTLRLITLPLLMPGIVSGAMLAFIISLDDFIITLMVAEAGSTTLPIYIYSLVRIGITPEVNAVSTVLLGFSVIVVTLSYVIGKKNKT